ncbi:MAG: SDR family oxidoreductase [Myxococcota bacterium]|nr:SDR family oxidoreductase [Myxococcota bacterium]
MKKTAVILASSEGIGFSSAKKLMEDGHRVVLFSRSEEKLERASKELTEAGGEVHAQVGDIGSQEDMDRLFSMVEEKWGGCDILVNNSGGPAGGGALGFEDEDWMSVMTGYALPIFRAIRRVVPYMQKQGWGRIITVASIAVKQPIDDLDLSNFLRGGLAAVHKTLARKLAKDGINVHMVLPGAILTERSRKRIQARADKNNMTFEESIKVSESRIPKGRLGHPDEVGDAVAFLASEKAEYLTAQYIQIDGGMLTGLY